MTKIERMMEIHKELFDIANSYAGDKTGVVAVKLHEACNSILEANDILKANDGKPLNAGDFVVVLTGLAAGRRGYVVKLEDSGKYKLEFDENWCGWYYRKELELLKSA